MPSLASLIRVTMRTQLPLEDHRNAGGQLDRQPGEVHTVTLANATATAGSIYAKWTITVAGTPQANQAWEATLTFP
jgi:hypothetical protein